MDSLRGYLVQIEGLVTSDELATSPCEVEVADVNTATTQLKICTDQSGLIGLLRYLHGRGFVLLSVSITQEEIKHVERR